jgi:hypothetical protein
MAMDSIPDLELASSLATGWRQALASATDWVLVYRSVAEKVSVAVSG